MQSFGFSRDERKFSCVPPILKANGIESITVITNNPQKEQRLRDAGVCITGRIGVHADDVRNEETLQYLRIKAEKGGHDYSKRLSAPPEPPIPTWRDAVGYLPSMHGPLVRPPRLIYAAAA
jgi:hypothetical protein